MGQFHLRGDLMEKCLLSIDWDYFIDAHGLLHGWTKNLSGLLMLWEFYIRWWTVR